MSEASGEELPLVYSKQFVASRNLITQDFIKEWEKAKIGNYHFYIQQNQKISLHSNEQNCFLLIGNMYDYRAPENTNDTLVSQLSILKSVEEVLNEIAHFSGEYVLAFQLKEETIVINDAGALMEIYYSKEFDVFASQVKLIAKIREVKIDSNPSAINFYKSQPFTERKFYVNDLTEFSNVQHLKPNYLLNLSEGCCTRFYPKKKLSPTGTKKTANAICEMLTGYIKAVSLRNEGTGGIGIPITAGWDSRILLAASIKARVSNARYYVFKHHWMRNDHPDIVIAKRIAELLKIHLEIIRYEDEIPKSVNRIFMDSLDHNRSHSNSSIYQAFYKNFGIKNTTIINGNVSEIARSYYPNIISLQGKDLARLSGYPNDRYVAETYNSWIDHNKNLFEKSGLNIMDMFYWEERVGIWVAKMKSAYLLFSDHFSPYNSRILLETALSSNRHARDAHFNTLYYEVLASLSSDLMKVPINPSPKTTFIKFMKQTKIYPFYQNIGIKLGFLKFK